MDASVKCEGNNEEIGKSRPLKSSIKLTKEKPALSPIEEETDSPDSSGDSTVNYHDIENVFTTKKCDLYDDGLGLCNDYERVLRDLDEKRSPGDKRRKDESPPFLTPRNSSEHEGKYNPDSSATTSNDNNSEDDEEELEDDEDSSLPGESTSGDVDYYREEDYNDADLDPLENYDLEIVPGEAGENLPASSSAIKKRTHRRPKSAPSCSFLDSSDTSRDDKFSEMSTTLDWLKARIVKSEREIFDMKKQLNSEKIRGRKLAKRYEDERNITRESLRIDLELWIKKLNDGLKEYLAEWQKRERLRLNEEISRISDLYSQEIAKSLKISLKEWHTEDKLNLLAVIEKRENLREENSKLNANVIYKKIQALLENLEQRNRKSYSTLCKRIDKWEERFKEEFVKLHEEDLKKLRQQVNAWCEETRKKSNESSVIRQKSKERCTEIKRSHSFLGAEALLHVEENLLKRLRDSSTKDLRRTEQIVRTELKSQRRELAKRMNDKISELWTAFEELGCSPGFFDRERPRGRNDLDECRAGIVGNRSKDAVLKPDVAGGRRIGGKIVRSNRPGRSSVSNSDFDEDDDRDYAEDEDETTGESSERNKNIERLNLSLGASEERLENNSITNTVISTARRNEFW